MPLSKSSRPISLIITREFNNVNGDIKSKEKNLNHSRYLKINQPEKTLNLKNTRVSQFQGNDEEEYERKKYIIEYKEDETPDNKNKNYSNSSTNETLSSMIDSDSDTKIDEHKVEKTFKMIEELLKENKPKKKVPIHLKLKNDSTSTSLKFDSKQLRTNKMKNISNSHRKLSVNEHKKHNFFKEKNIRVNISTADTEDSHRIIKKPVKINVTNEVNQINESLNEDAKIDLHEVLKKDQLQYAPDGKAYLNKLVKDVDKITRNMNKQKIDLNDNTIDKSDSQKENQNNGSNSLGLAMEGGKGFNLAIVKGKLENETELLDETNKNQTVNNENQVLLKTNYQDLENLINTLTVDNSDENYLKIAKLNRLKVLMELSMKMVGRKYKEISDEERNILETEANRFHKSYPLPGEETPVEEIDKNGVKQARLPLKIIQNEDSNAKIDINSKYFVDPSEFLTIYASQIVNTAQDSTGLAFDNITVTIPAAYGTKQREAIKNSVNEATERDDVQILTRPVAAAVLLTNQRSEPNEKSSSSTDECQNLPESYKLVFDITESSLDASVIRIINSKDFQVISNVGDTSFGLEDINQRILEYIVKEKEQRDRRNGQMRTKSAQTNKKETINEYSNLIEYIKRLVLTDDNMKIDLSSLNRNTTAYKNFTNKNNTKTNKKSTPISNLNNELSISKKLISKTLCKDIYDWSIVHIEKAILQADINDNKLDEIIIIGNKSKMPGFYEILKETFSEKNITFVDGEDLALGAAIVGQKSKYQQIKITEVLCKSIGIGLYSGVITYLLFRNSSLPCVGGCVYSTLIDNQESMVLDVYEGERPHIKFCRYLGEVTVLGLPKREAGSVKCELFIKMNHEGILEVNAKDLKSGKQLETKIDASPDQIDNNDVNNDTDLDPIEAERYKKQDYDLVYELESLDDYLEELTETYRSHKYSKYISEKIFETKEWLFQNRRIVSIDECKNIRAAILKFLKNIS